MAKNSKQVDRESAEDETERRFNETVRNLLHTPPKPHKDKGAGKAAGNRDRRNPKTSDR